MEVNNLPQSYLLRFPQPMGILPVQGLEVDTEFATLKAILDRLHNQDPSFYCIDGIHPIYGYAYISKLRFNEYQTVPRYKTDENRVLQLYIDPQAQTELIQRIRDEYKQNLIIRELQPAYYETIAEGVEHEGLYINASSGPASYGRVSLRLEPISNDAVLLFRNTWYTDLFKQVSREKVVRAIWEGVRDAALSRGYWGYPLLGIEVTLFGGTVHLEKAEERDFWRAAGRAFIDAVRQVPRVLIDGNGQVVATRRPAP